MKVFLGCNVKGGKGSDGIVRDWYVGGVGSGNMDSWD